MLLSTLNQSLFEAIHRFAGRSIFLDNVGIFFAEYLPYLMVVVFLLLALGEKGWRRRFYYFSEGAIAVMLARGLVTEIIRQFYHHERPFSFYGFAPLIAESGWSFPSGHMTWFFALSMTVWYVNRKWGIGFFVLSAIMGIARIYVGVHWPYDVASGAVIGLLCGWFAHWLFRNTRKKLYAEASPVSLSSTAVQ